MKDRDSEKSLQMLTLVPDRSARKTNEMKGARVRNAIASRPIIAVNATTQKNVRQSADYLEAYRPTIYGHIVITATR